MGFHPKEGNCFFFLVPEVILKQHSSLEINQRV